jgi:hypothetical protein
MRAVVLRFAEFADGDILACFGTGWARAISLRTSSLTGPRRLRFGPSHVGIILGDSRKLVEATSLCDEPCDFAGRRVSGVQLHDPMRRVEQYTAAGGRVDVYRLSHFWRFGFGESVDAWELCRELLQAGTVYDFLGAGLSGTRFFQLSRLFPAADLSTVFCSELVAALLMRLGRLPIGNATRFNPGRLMRALVKSGVYRFHRSFEGGPCEN